MTKSCEFSTAHYREALETGLKKGYRFIRFEELASVSPGERICILRHDEDYMPEWALHFGKIEYDLGIRATYFFQVCAKTYNLRETQNRAAVLQLGEWGHTIGLHFDPTWAPDAKWEDLPALCVEDKKVFEAITGLRPCEIVSFHNPHRFVEKILNAKIPNLRHTYEKEFFSSIKYLSDSQGWYEGCICKIFETQKYDRIQLCTHPYLWPEVPAGDFIRDMAAMVKFRTEELTQYLLTYHPVCKKNEARLQQALAALFCPPPK